MKNVVLLALLTGVATALVPQATARQHVAGAVRTVQAAKQVAPPESTALLRTIESHRDETWRWQRVMQRPRTPYSDSARADVESRLPQVGGRAVAASGDRRPRPWRNGRRTGTSGSASTATKGRGPIPSAPYYGGLQMDMEFQRTYGLALYRAKGTADHWTPARADVGGGAGLPNPRFLAMAEHREVLRLALRSRAVRLT